MLHPWLSVSLVLAVLGGLMLGLQVYQRRWHPHPELVRKLLHVAMGLTTLTFPWLFHSWLPVAILAVLAVGWLLSLRFYKPLQQLGSILAGVERQSLGEIYFPIAVALVFALAGGNRLLYSIPILILTLADAVAAMIGVRYGQIHYSATEGQKSAEGSLAFFVATFFSVHVPLLLFSQTGRAETLLIALILGLLVMLIEAIAWRGLDNLLIPLGGFILLKTHISMSLTDLLIRLGVTVALVILVLIWRKYTTLTDSALLTAALIGYLSWTLGGWQWLIPPLILFITYPLFVPWIDQQKTPLTPEERQVMLWLPTNPDTQPRQWQRIHSLYSVLSVCAAGLLWLFLFGISSNPKFIAPYMLAFTMNLAFVGISGLSPISYWHSSRWLTVINHVLKACTLIILPMIIINRFSIAFAMFGLVSLAGTLIVSLFYYVIQPTLRQRFNHRISWLCRAALTTIGSSLGLLPFF